ncbi:MAG: DUF4440 domain-containing protein [Acidobacteria bacterium]|nr:MAG: DUF4440 domain-containing protein [Acidobacteriota bacterium]
MIARVFMAALLLHSSPLAAQTATPPPPLDAAERALVSALMLPDREAFRQLLAADAVFDVPVEVRGPDAIVQKWLPFLASPEVRMAPIIETSTTAETGKTGETSGTFAVYGRTTKGMTMTSVGAFSITWRLVEGRWKIERLSRNKS